MAMRKWFLGDRFEEEAKTGEFFVLALRVAPERFAFFCPFPRRKNVLLPSELGWPNYVGIAKGFNLDIQFYNAFHGMGLLISQGSAKPIS
jgi:hypothetical protein